MPTFAIIELDGTERLARAMAGLLQPGDVVELHGLVGAGKTTFVTRLAVELGATEPARSPTYTVAHRYELADGRALTHLDCYRATGPLDDAAWGDVEPYFEDAIACVEWPEPIRPWLADRPTWTIRLDTVVGRASARVADVTGPTPERSMALLDAWTATRP